MRAWGVAYLSPGLGSFSHIVLFISLAVIDKRGTLRPKKLERDSNPGVASPLRSGRLTFTRWKEGPLAPSPRPPTWLLAHPASPIPLPRALLQDPPPSQAGQVLGDIRAWLPPSDATWPRPALDRGGSLT